MSFDPEYASRQFEIHKLYAMMAFAEATTGVCTLKKIEQGVAGGKWRELTNEEKTQEALEKMQRHIHIMNQLNEALADNKSVVKKNV